MTKLLFVCWSCSSPCNKKGMYFTRFFDCMRTGVSNKHKIQGCRIMTNRKASGALQADGSDSLTSWMPSEVKRHDACATFWTGLSLDTGNTVRRSMSHYGSPGLINACHSLVNTNHGRLKVCGTTFKMASYWQGMQPQRTCQGTVASLCLGDSGLTGSIRAFIGLDGKAAGHSAHICSALRIKWERNEE